MGGNSFGCLVLAVKRKHSEHFRDPSFVPPLPTIRRDDGAIADENSLVAVVLRAMRGKRGVHR